MAPDIVPNIIDRLGVDRIRAAVNVTEHAVRYARSARIFPARWFGPLSRLCHEEGIPCPLDAFAWAEPARDGDGGRRKHDAQGGTPISPAQAPERGAA